MGRQIITRADIEGRAARLHAQEMGSVAAAPSAPPVAEADQYKDRLLKYIPADVVAIYVTLRGIMESVVQPAPTRVLYWVIFGLLLVVTVPWQRRVAGIGSWSQVLIGTGAFVFWAVSLGHPFSTDGLGQWWQPAYGALLLALYTFLIPLFEPK